MKEKLSDYQESLASPRVEMLERLDNLYLTLKQPGWDGYNAKPIDSQSYHTARQIIRNMPDEIITLWNVFPSPKGIISFEFRPKEVAALKVYEDRIHFVAMNREGKPLMGHLILNASLAAETLIKITEFLGYGRKKI